MSELAWEEAAGYSAPELDATAGSIEAVQHRDGMLPWFAGGHADPWNHVEAAMALSATGRVAAAERAYEWLRATQRPDGAWHAYYGPDGDVEEPRLDTNVTAYVAAGVRHHHLVTGDRSFLEQMWPVVEAAVCFALRSQRTSGEVPWAVDPDGTPGGFALLAASSSLCTSVRAAVSVAHALGIERPRWERSLALLERAVATRPWSFAPKGEFAMDWYYPVLAGAVRGHAARARLDRGWRTFVLEGSGVLCRSDRRWVTTAETAECAIACARAGRVGAAAALLCWTRAHRGDDGSYVTGLVHPGRDEFPRGERTTYSAAAVVLAAEVLAGRPATVEVLAPTRADPAS
ncbi:MAG: prenyltransferase [Actinomycetota bacterium]|nr:prenyltransferase [Actinomycetota bacterium]